MYIWKNKSVSIAFGCHCRTRSCIDLTRKRWRWHWTHIIFVAYGEGFAYFDYHIYDCMYAPSLACLPDQYFDIGTTSNWYWDTLHTYEVSLISYTFCFRTTTSSTRTLFLLFASLKSARIKWLVLKFILNFVWHPILHMVRWRYFALTLLRSDARSASV